MNQKKQTSLGKLYELKLIMVRRLEKYKSKNPGKDTGDMEEMLELLNSGIEGAEYLRLSCQWLQEELDEWECFSDEKKKK